MKAFGRSPGVPEPSVGATTGAFVVVAAVDNAGAVGAEEIAVELAGDALTGNVSGPVDLRTHQLNSVLRHLCVADAVPVFFVINL